MKTLHYLLPNEQATINVGKTIAAILTEQKVSQLQKIKQKRGITVYLYGDLGAGKTTLTRGFVCGMGHKSNVKSPTYTLVEPYEIEDWHIFHFDLYRLADPEELEYMGIRDYFADHCCSFIEWPEKGGRLLAPADFSINLVYSGEQRKVTLTALTTWGDEILTLFTNKFNEGL